MLEKATTQAITTEVLKALNLEPSQVDSLQTISYAQLSAAGKKALKVIADRMKAEGKPVVGFGLSWGPSRDGEDLPYQLFSKEAFELSKDVPLLIGTVKNEFMPSLFSGLSNAPLDKVTETIKKQQGDKADAYIAAVKKAYPNDTRPSDLMDVDAMFRPGAVSQAKEKSALNAAPVFMYLFTWQSPVMDGKYKAVHCMEIPFVFNNIARCEEMTGGAKEAYALADKVSNAWINFARSGNPGHKGLPSWPAFNATNTATMHFDNTCVVKPQMDKELFDLLGK
jgi:para-nitrobenzyl esterase